MNACTIEGCTGKYRARGYCASHYNQILKPDRHRKVEVPCTWCGKPCMKELRSRTPFCSYECRDAWRWEPVRQRKLPVLHPNPTLIAKIRVEPIEPVRDTRPRFTAGTCVWCALAFVTDRLSFENGTATHCSARCAKAHSRYRRRTRKRGAYVANVIRNHVFDRDGWRCQICWRKVNPKASVPNPRAATLDHIVPLSMGGTHEPINCQTACFSCNSLKGNRHGYGDQLRLLA